MHFLNVACFFILPLFAWEISPLFVSLGSHCEPTIILREEGLRQRAFPFDWLVTIDTEGLITLLNEDFRHLFNRDDLFSPLYPECIEHNRYKIEFKHDGPFLQTAEIWQNVVEKYQRRIDRFRSLRDFSGKVFFIRVAYDPPEGGPTWWLKQPHIDSNQAKALKEALDRYFPHLDFTLLVINYLEDFPSPLIEQENLLAFKISKKGKKAEYLTLFSYLVPF